MSNFVTVTIAAELLRTTKNSIMVTACATKRKLGKYPAWYISSGARGASRSWVDIDVLHHNRQLIRSTWMRSTDELYWILSDTFKMSDAVIAKQLSRHSKVFKNVDSWKTFLNNVLFRLPPETVYTLADNMHLEFFKLSIRIIALANRTERMSYESSI